MFEIFCLMVEKIGLSNAMRTDLLKAAKVMVANKKKSLKIVTDDLEAFIQTEFKYTGFGSIYGIQFEADISSVRGKGKAHYIVLTRDLELVNLDEGFWMACCEPWLIPPSAEKIMSN